MPIRRRPENRASPDSRLLQVACGPDSHPAPSIAELCGAAEPHQLFAASEHEFPRSTQEFGERWLIAIDAYEAPVAELLEGSDASPAPILSERISRTTWSVDACGGDRQIVARDVDRVFVPPESDGPILGCRYLPDATLSELLLLDFGEAVSQEVLSVESCGFIRIDGSIVAQAAGDSDQAGPIVRIDFSTDPPSIHPLLDSVATWTSGAGGEPYVWTSPDAAYALDTGGVLAELDLVTGKVTEIALDVTDFTVGERGRFIAWTHHSEYPGIGQWMLLDRQTEQRLELGSADGSPEYVNLWPGVADVIPQALNGPPRRQFVLLPEMTTTRAS